jgi:hypothetical protein
MAARTRLWIVGGALILCALAAAAFWLFHWLDRMKWAEAADGARLKFRVQGERFERYEKGEWQPFFPQGVNLGASLPGHYPGEMPIDKDTYLRWFSLMTEMGSNVVRVYTIHPPHFYEALVEYNKRNPGRPLYLIQGVWSPEEMLIEKRDAFDPEIVAQFRKEIADAVGAVYGDVTLEPSPGKASGTYTANAGPYLFAWHIGTEWDPQMVVDTNKRHQDRAGYAGEYIRTRDGASPFESWLAELLDLTARLERQRGYAHPVAFTNWVTTDPLHHPGEPTFEEDMVSVDATHLEPGGWEAGYFASFHVYPYYPDLFRFDQTLREVVNEDGQPDPYRTYLRRLKRHHEGMPVIVAEFGVPSSWGIGHTELLGRNQGGHNEREQGEVVASLFRTIVEEDLAGAIVFAWQDEWFKKTWNTMRYEVPEDRRAYWLNVLSNEQMFGLIGMYPSKEETLIIDGARDDWERLDESEKTRLIADGDAVKELWVAHDEAYVYLLAELHRPFDPAAETLYIGADILPGGNRHAEELADRTLDEGLETLIVIDDDEAGDIRIASNYDVHTRMYGYVYGMIPFREEELRDDSGVFKPWKLTVGLKMEPPYTRVEHPFEDVPAGILRRGTTDPADPDYDSMAAWEASGTVIEMRIPWNLLGYSDPSSRQAISYQLPKGKYFESETSEGIRFVPWIRPKHRSGVIGLGSGPEAYAVSELPIYRWKEWEEQVNYIERIKQSYNIVKQAFWERRGASDRR